jgi:hypothetical protein
MPGTSAVICSKPVSRERKGKRPLLFRIQAHHLLLEGDNAGLGGGRPAGIGQQLFRRYAKGGDFVL